MNKKILILGGVVIVLVLSGVAVAFNKVPGVTPPAWLNMTQTDTKETMQFATAEEALGFMDDRTRTTTRPIDGGYWLALERGAKFENKESSPKFEKGAVEMWSVSTASEDPELLYFSPGGLCNSLVVDEKTETGFGAELLRSNCKDGAEIVYFWFGNNGKPDFSMTYSDFSPEVRYQKNGSAAVALSLAVEGQCVGNMVEGQPTPQVNMTGVNITQLQAQTTSLVPLSSKVAIDCAMNTTGAYRVPGVRNPIYQNGNVVVEVGPKMFKVDASDVTGAGGQFGEKQG